MPTLSPTTFSAGANEALITVDVYKQASAGILNGVKDLLIGNISSTAVSALVNTPITAQALTSPAGSFVTANAGKLTLNPDAVIKGLIQSNPSLVGAIKSMSSTVQSNLLDVDSVTNNIKVTVGSIVSQVNAADLTTVANLGKMVTDLTQDMSLPFSFKDVGAMTGLATNLIKETAAIGMTGVYTAFSNAATFTAPIMANITEAIAPTMIELANNKLLTEVSMTAGALVINNKFPNFVPDYLSSYKTQFQSLKQQVDMGSEAKNDFIEMSQAFDRIDPDWSTAQREGQDTLSAIYMTNASDEAIEAIQISVDADAPDVAALADIAAAEDAFENMNTASHASLQTYTLAVQNTLTTDAKISLSDEMPLVNFYF